VENMVKIWEMEASHKKKFAQWISINHDKYDVQINGGPIIEGKDAFKMGNYNVTLSGCPAYKKREYLVTFF
jgi:hypothetical protein